MKWAGGFALKVEKKRGHRIVVGNQESKRPFERPAINGRIIKK
jgi:hypothetical protein